MVTVTFQKSREGTGRRPGICGTISCLS